MATRNASVIGNEADYNAAVAEVEHLFGAEPGTVAAARFFPLASLVEACENQHHVIEPPTEMEKPPL